MLFALHVKVNEIQTSADPAFFWLRARHLCFLTTVVHPHSGEIMGLLKLEDYMPAALANSLKADEEDRRSDHAPLVAVADNEEVATLTATIETNLWQGRQACVAPFDAVAQRRPGGGLCPALPVPRVRLRAGDEQRGLARDAEVRPICFARVVGAAGPGEPCDSCAGVIVDSSPRCGGFLLSHLLTRSPSAAEAARGGEREGRLHLDQ